jgi:hypothetical protein
MRRCSRCPRDWPFAANDTPELLHRAFSGIRDAFPDTDGTRAEVLPDRRLRQRTPRDSRQRQARTQRPQPGHPLYLRMDEPSRRLPPRWNRQTNARVRQPVNDVGEPCAREPHARFDEAAGGNPRPVGDATQSPEPSRRPYRGAAAPRLPLRRVVDAKQKWPASWMTPARHSDSSAGRAGSAAGWLALVQGKQARRRLWE